MTPAGHSLIGGVFGLATEGSWERPCPFRRGTELPLVNGRSAIWLLLQMLRPRRLWLPSFLCPSILESTRDVAVGVRFFPVGDDLEPEPGWADPIEAGDLVVLIAYFGWRPSNTTIAEAQARRAMVLEDASQALLTHSAGAGADFVLFSPRKTVAVPDGGILSGSLSGLTPLPLEPPPESWLHKAVEARRQRGQYDAYGGDRTWFTLYQDAEEHAPVGPYAMSPLTARLLSTAFDYDDVADRRRANYLALLQHLRSLAVRPELPPGVVPLGFPIRVEDRAALLNHLYAQQIYPPVHWPISGIVPEAFEASHRLSGEILTLPCDQRYGDQEMLRVVQHVLEAQAR